MATQVNMLIVSPARGEPVAVPGVVACSFEIGDVYASGPGDDRFLEDGGWLKDRNGNEGRPATGSPPLPRAVPRSRAPAPGHCAATRAATEHRDLSRPPV
jgi:hypothetical protein